MRVLGLNGRKIREIEEPWFFKGEVREDLIKRVVVAMEANRKQPQGRDVMAGKRTTAESWGVGYGRARVPRDERGRGRLITGAVGGRRAHPPRAEKKIERKVNKKEKKLALISALIATAREDYVRGRGHKINDKVNLPIIITNKIEKIEKTQKLIEVLQRLGLKDELERCKKGIKKRSGKSRMRNRTKRKPRGPLIVVEDGINLYRAARNIPGVEVMRARELNVEHLAPGGQPGRLVIWTPQSLKVIEERLGGIKE
ncbi:50S ribosomal protein L4 [Candidatus Bathyarchaeota archaeon ex4484_205]|nr:MAG: 50S ribosomal protein L4 [Candidatus Bathyarchaeota archaeon ex4484_205]RLG69412.1 MAG: 50S ribosomal protein L4 [archaeon]